MLRKQRLAIKNVAWNFMREAAGTKIYGLDRLTHTSESFADPPPQYHRHFQGGAKKSYLERETVFENLRKTKLITIAGLRHSLLAIGCVRTNPFVQNAVCATF